MMIDTLDVIKKDINRVVSSDSRMGVPRKNTQIRFNFPRKKVLNSGSVFHHVT